MLKYIKCAVLTALIIFNTTLTYAVDKEEVMTQGQFARYLVNALALNEQLPASPSTQDYFRLLESRGVTPPGGFDAEKVLTNKDMVILLERALGLEKEVIKKLTEGGASAISADELFAYVVEVQGDVEIRIGQGQWIPARKGIRLKEGDSVRTGEDSWAALGIGKLGAVKVKGNSEIVLQELSFNPDKTENVFIYLQRGDMLVNAGELKEGARFEAATPVSVAAVKGTVYTLSYNGQNMQVQVTDGTVTAYALDSSGNPVGDPVEININEYISQTGSQPAGSAQALSQAMANAINSEAGNLQNMVEAALGIAIGQLTAGMTPEEAQAAIEQGLEIAIQAAMEALAEIGIQVEGSSDMPVTFGQALQILSQGGGNLETQTNYETPATPT
ncbi:MAG: FecR domain-containing protein [Candidatus Aureabacteria bacterium]|nr:FecR domain-containing protein [Candidatus Auribacterota bacterium]